MFRSTAALGQFRQTTLNFAKRSSIDAVAEQPGVGRLSLQASINRRDQIKKLLQREAAPISTAPRLVNGRSGTNTSQSLKPPPFGRIYIPPSHLLLPRLQLREFCIRFEKLFQKLIPAKNYAKLMTIMESTDFGTQRHLTTALLKIIDYAEEPTIDPDMIKTHLQQVNKASEESGQLWKLVSSLLSSQTEILVNEDDEDEIAEVNQLYWMNKLCDLALTGEYLREELETSAETVRKATLRLVKDKAGRRSDYEKSKAVMQKKKLLWISKEQMLNWQEQWVTAADKQRSRIKQLDKDFWQLQRSKQLRTAPIGRDCRDNTFWIFGHSDRVNPHDNLGDRIIIEVAPGNLHPECRRNIKGDCNACSHKAIDVLEVDEILWYQVTTPASVRELSQWVQSEATACLGPNPKGKDARSKEVRSELGKSLSRRGAQAHTSTCSEIRSIVAETKRDIHGVVTVEMSATPLQESLEDWQSIEMLIKKIDLFADYMD